MAGSSIPQRTTQRQAAQPNIGFDRAGPVRDRTQMGGVARNFPTTPGVSGYGRRPGPPGMMSGPPGNIGADRAGGHGFADFLRDIHSGGKTFPHPGGTWDNNPDNIFPNPLSPWSDDDSNLMEPMGSGDYLSSRYGGGLGGNEGGFENAGLYQTWKNIKNRLGEIRANQWLEEQQTAEMGGYGYSPDPYDDDDEYGPFVPPSVIDMDLEGIGYDPADDEYDFDRKRGFPGRKFGRGYKGPKYSARGGIMSLKR